jgi:flagellar hook protein FlgE
MAFQQGLSGLNSSSKALDVISSNVANASTAGFKASSAVFADSFASAMGGGGNAKAQVGMGSLNQAVRQGFSQGAITSTNNPLDMAIGGNGFFLIERNNGTMAYTRNGQFDLDKNGYIVSPLGEKVLGYQTLQGDGTVAFIGNTAPRPLMVPPIGIAAKATGASIPPGEGEPVRIRGNLDSSLPLPANPTFSKANPQSYNFATSATVYDSLGNRHTAALFFVKQAEAPAVPPVPPATVGTPAVLPNTWRVYSAFDTEPAQHSATLVFDENTGNLKTSGDPPVHFSSGVTYDEYDSASNSRPPLGMTSGSPFFTMIVPSAQVGTGAAGMDFNIDLSAFTQRRTVSGVYETIQDGSPPGEVANVSVSSEGLITARYTNGQSADLGKVVLATFRNPNGLMSIGDNLWSETVDSGLAAVAGPGEGLNGTINAGRIEESNVDMSQELVMMIIQQRNYQANAQSIKTQDQILQTLINMR